VLACLPGILARLFSLLTHGRLSAMNGRALGKEEEEGESCCWEGSSSSSSFNRKKVKVVRRVEVQSSELMLISTPGRNCNARTGTLKNFSSS
jgi:hypothetical protein